MAPEKACKMLVKALAIVVEASICRVLAPWWMYLITPDAQHTGSFVRTMRTLVALKTQTMSPYVSGRKCKVLYTSIGD